MFIQTDKNSQYLYILSRQTIAVMKASKSQNIRIRLQQ